MAYIKSWGSFTIPPHNGQWGSVRTGSIYLGAKTKSATMSFAGLPFTTYQTCMHACVWWSPIQALFQAPFHFASELQWDRVHSGWLYWRAQEQDDVRWRWEGKKDKCCNLQCREWVSGWLGFCFLLWFLYIFCYDFYIPRDKVARRC